MKRLWAYAERYWARWLWGCVLLLLTNAAAMTVPQLFRFAVDALHQGAPLTDLRVLALTLILIALCGAVFRTLSRIHIFYAARDVEMDLRCDFYRHLSGQQPSFFTDHPTGDLMSRATNDLGQVRLLLGPGVLNVINTTIAYCQAIPLMLLISGKLTLLVLALYPPGLLLMRYLAWQLFRRTRAQQQVMGDLSSFVQENLAGAHVVRAFKLEQAQQKQFEQLNKGYYEASVRLAWVRSGVFRVVITLGNVGVLLAVYFGAREALMLRLSLGELVAMVEYMALLTWPTFALGWMLSAWQRGAAAMSRLSEVLDVEPTVRSGEAKPSELMPSVDIHGLRLSLGGREVLRGINVSVPPGATLGVVGPIGGGKTLLAQCMLRLLDVSPQQVYIGGVDVTDLDLGSLRERFGYVPQDHTLFSKTVAENVAFGHPGLARAEIEAAVAAAALDGDLEAFPKGLDTPVGERGITLSGGQKQRLAIARALVLDPPILVLDDALSSVDAVTEATILERLRKSRQGRTTIIVAHRISAVEHADEIVVLERGSIVERGQHDDLLAFDGLYALMASRQRLEHGPPRLQQEPAPA